LFFAFLRFFLARKSVRRVANMKLSRIASYMLLLAVLALSVSAQTNTYPFPSSGSVGIGTTSPQSQLALGGNISSQNTAAFDQQYSSITFQNLNSAYLIGRIAAVEPSGHYPDSGALVFSTAYGTLTEKMRIDPWGNVGIGTASPGSAKLAVVGSADAGFTNNPYVLLLRDTRGMAAGVGGGVVFEGSYTGTNPIAFGAISGIKENGVDTNYAGALTFMTRANGSGAGNQERMRITSAGNVGIGTTSPGQTLDVFGNIGVAGYLGFSIFDWTDTDANWRIGMNDKTSAVGFSRALATAHVQYLTFASGAGQGFAVGDKVSGLSAFEVTGAGSGYNAYFRGNVGIGTTNPGTNKLAVNGTIRAKEVIVDTGWSDYVFAADYALAPLSEVEAHIKTHHTLPGVPSASEVADHGISIGDMQAKLLAKIEELTLHQIAGEKAIAELANKNIKLETRVAELEGAVKL
jgi:hypothetical protein